MLNTKLKEFNLVNEALKLNKKLFNVHHYKGLVFLT